MRAAVGVLLAFSAMVVFSFFVFQAPPSIPSGSSHWAGAVLTAFAIVFSMGCLVAFATGAGGRRGR